MPGTCKGTNPLSRPPRITRLPALVGAIGVAALLALLLLLVPATGPASIPEAPENALAAAARATVAPPPAVRVETRFLGHGGTLAGALDELVDDEEARRAVLDAAGRYLDLRRLSPRTGLAVQRDATGRAIAVSIRSEPKRFLRVRLPAGKAGKRAELLDLPVEIEVRRTAGVVRNSVAQALTGSPYGRWLTAAFADIVQWDVDLLVDPRPGDHVRVIYEVRRLGPVPADLPPFGDAAVRPGEMLGPGRILAARYEGRMASASAFWIHDGKAGGGYYDDEGQPLHKSFLKSPLNYRRISSGFSNSRLHPVTRRVVPHHGVDFAANSGTPVVATADGRLIRVGWDGALGNALRIRHGSEYVTVYGHLRGFARGIRAGVDVKQNQVIGYVGSTGRATGPHVHYSVLLRDRPINPLRMENPPAEPLDTALIPWLAAATRRWSPLLDTIRPDDPSLEIATGDPSSDPTTEVLSGM